MSEVSKVRENRARRMAARQGLALVKSRRRDEHALDYGRYWLLSPHNSNALVAGGEWGITLEEVEHELTSDREAER